MYGVLFGKNPMSKVLLSMLDLDESKVGRFRDCFISDGMIAVYTRNGGGNRECWHEDNPELGNRDCDGEVWEEEVDETVEVSKEEATEKGYTLLNCWIGGKRLAKTGRKIMVERFTCSGPNSSACSCPGCIITYRLPDHPLYVLDADDDFDCTYATIYFRFPDEFSEDLKKLDLGERFDPSERWEKRIKDLSETL